MSKAAKYRRELEKFAKGLGFVMSRTGSDHLRWDHPDLRHPVFTPSTPTVATGVQERQKLRRALRQGERRQRLACDLGSRTVA